MNKNIIISKSKSAVVINYQECEGEVTVWANLYVNAKIDGNRLLDGDITLRRWEGKTIKGAEKWAKKVLES